MLSAKLNNDVDDDDDDDDDDTWHLTYKIAFSFHISVLFKTV